MFPSKSCFLVMFPMQPLSKIVLKKIRGDTKKLFFQGILTNHRIIRKNRDLLGRGHKIIEILIITRIIKGSQEAINRFIHILPGAK